MNRRFRIDQSENFDAEDFTTINRIPSAPNSSRGSKRDSPRTINSRDNIPSEEAYESNIDEYALSDSEEKERTEKKRMDTPYRVINPKKNDDDSDSLYEIGDRIYGRYQGGESFYPGVILNRTKDHQNFHIRYDDGEEEFPVNKNFLTKVKPKGKITIYGKSREENNKSKAQVPSSNDFNNQKTNKSIGEKINITVLYGETIEKFPATIESINEDGTYNIIYADGQLGRDIENSTIKIIKDDDSTGKVGEYVEVVVLINDIIERFPGRIIAVNTNRLYDVKYLNGNIGYSIGHESVLFPKRESKKQKTMFNSNKSFSNSSSPRQQQQQQQQQQQLMNTKQSSSPKNSSPRNGMPGTSSLPAQRISSPNFTQPASENDFKSREKVLIFSNEENTFVPAEIRRVNTDGSYDVKMESGSTIPRVHPSYLKPYPSKNDKSFDNANRKQVHFDSADSSIDFKGFSKSLGKLQRDLRKINPSDGASRNNETYFNDSITSALLTSASITEAAVKASAQASSVTAEAVRAASLITQALSSMIPPHGNNQLQASSFNNKNFTVVSNAKEFDEFSIGDVIPLQFQAKIIRINEDGTYDLKFDNDQIYGANLLFDDDKNVKNNLMSNGIIMIGDRVEVAEPVSPSLKKKGMPPTYQEALVVDITEDGLYTVKYNDLDDFRYENVSSDRIRNFQNVRNEADDIFKEKDNTQKNKIYSDKSNIPNKNKSDSAESNIMELENSNKEFDDLDVELSLELDPIDNKDSSSSSSKNTKQPPKEVVNNNSSNTKKKLTTSFTTTNNKKK